MSMTPFEKELLSPVFEKKRIALGISGSIAAFKCHDLIRDLRDLGSEVRVILTQGAEKFVTPTTLATLSGHAVCSPQVSEPVGSHSAHLSMDHIETARWADLMLVAPATAHQIAKMAHGFADDFLSTQLLAFLGPVAVAPAMNPAMFQNPAVQENLEKIRKRGVWVLGPDEGKTACGETGFGRMMEPQDLLRELALRVPKSASSREHKSFLITLGATRSFPDPVRYLTNRSSGLMGVSLCWAAAQRGHFVTAICGPSVEAPLPPSTKRISVETSEEMFQAVESQWSKTEVFIAAAAVLDWKFKNQNTAKIKKTSSSDLTLQLAPTTDILAWAGKNRVQGRPLIVGFAAETENVKENGESKLVKKGCDALFANSVLGPNGAFESLDNSGYWIQKGSQPIKVSSQSKPRLAHSMINWIEKLSHKNIEL